MTKDSNSDQESPADPTMAWLAHDYQGVFDWFRDEVGSIAWRTSQIRDFRNLWVISTAERLIRWDSKHPDEIFRTGFTPRASPPQLMDIIRPSGFNLRNYAEDNIESIFVGAARTCRLRKGQVTRWKPYRSPSRTHFEYEVFAFGGIDVNLSLGDDYKLREQHEIAFPGGIRPESIRSAIEYDPGTDNPIRVWYNKSFSPQQTVIAPDQTSSLPPPTEAAALEAIHWTPAYTSHPGNHAEDNQYVELMREPGEPAIDPLMSINLPTTGSFSTGSAKSRVISFSQTYQSPPGLSMGLTRIDAGCNANIRAHCFDNQVNNTGFTININTWGSSTLHGGSCMWMEIPPNLEYQYGEYTTVDDHPSDQHQKETKAKITFRQAYTERPKVVVWLTLIDMGKAERWRVKAYVTDITPTDFIIHLDTWGDSKLHCAKACWVAYPGDSTNINSGSFNTTEQRPSEIGWVETKGKTIFRYLLDDKPRVMAALNFIEADCKKNLRVGLKTDILPNQEGFEWSIWTWCDKNLYSAGASWIAWE